MSGIPNLSSEVDGKLAALAKGSSQNGDLFNKQSLIFMGAIFGLVGVLMFMLGFGLIITGIVAFVLALAPAPLLTRKRDGRTIGQAMLDNARGKRISRRFYLGRVAVIEEPRRVRIVGIEDLEFMPADA